VDLLVERAASLQAFAELTRHASQAADIVAAMTYRAVLRGYLLEEALAWLHRAGDTRSTLLRTSCRE
jgi:hypothetical protein